jgi:hypothetical protein
MREIGITKSQRPPTHRRHCSRVGSYSLRLCWLGSSDRAGSGSYGCRRPHGKSSIGVVAANAGEMSSPVPRLSARL